MAAINKSNKISIGKFAFCVDAKVCAAENSKL